MNHLILTHGEVTHLPVTQNKMMEIIAVEVAVERDQPILMEAQWDTQMMEEMVVMITHTTLTEVMTRTDILIAIAIENIQYQRHNTPGIMEAVEHHCTHMHERLLQLIQEHVSVYLSIPEGTKLHHVEHSSISKSVGSSKFGDLEKWLTNLVILFEVSMYGGDNCDKKRVLSTLEFLDGEAHKWYHRHVVNVHHAHLCWTFEEVIMGLYNQFVQPSTMQDTHKEFLSTSYNALPASKDIMIS